MYANSKAVFLLDLCTLAYQLHSQTLIWPMDPYYEQLGDKSDDLRDQFMANVRRDALKFRALGAYRGPADFIGTAAAGWQPNNQLDPIISEYGRIYPWRPSFTRPKRGEWILYNTPSVITDRIGTVRMAIYDPNAGPNAPAPGPTLQGAPFPLQNPNNPNGPDLLYGFEGGTGGIEGSTTHAWSMMGFVLAEFPAGQGQPYDVYVVFRGSRSGKVRPVQSFRERGNPDWATDLDLRQVDNDPAISAYGSVSRGFRASMKSVLPTIIACLTHLQATQGPPRAIYVTGHSLGGALAAHFTSAVVLSNRVLWPQNLAQQFQLLQNWPWRTIQLTTFSAPSVGGKTFRQEFDMNVPSARIWLDGDPITQEQIREPVGLPLRIPVYDDRNRPIPMVASLDSHEPYLVRRNLIRDRLANGLPVANLPANTGGGEPAEPWQIFTSFRDMMVRLTGQGPAGLNYQDTQGFFSIFKPNFKRYVSQLTSLPVSTTEITRYLNAFLTDQEDAMSLGNLRVALAAGAPLGANMWDFVLMCYLMGQGSVNIGAFDTAINGFAAPFYANLR